MLALVYPQHFIKIWQIELSVNKTVAAGLAPAYNF